MTADTIAALPDGLHVAVCGASSALPDPGAAAPAPREAAASAKAAGVKALVLTHAVPAIEPDA